MPTINKLPLLGTPSSGDQIPVYAPNSGDARRMSITALTDYMQDTLDLPDNSDEVSFLQSGTGAVTRTVQSKLRDVVSVKDFGAVGDGVTDDTAAIQAALNSGAKTVLGVSGATFLVSYAGAVTVNGVSYRRCLLVPSGVTFDLNGATIKQANSQNASVIAIDGATDSAVINSVIDSNKANQTTPATGEIAGILVHNCTRPRLQNLRAINNRQFAGRFLKNTGGSYVGLTCTDSDADGWSFGIDGGWSAWVTNAFIDQIYAESCTQVYGGGYQGNGAIFTVQRCQVGTVIARNCSGGIKIQDSSLDSSFESLTFIGQTNGTANSGIKIQGNAGSALYPKRIRISNALSNNAFGNGFFTSSVESFELANYQGVSNGTGSGAAGSDQYDSVVSIIAGGRALIGRMDIDSPATRGVVFQGAGSVFADTLFVRNPTGRACQISGDATFEAYIDKLVANDSGATMDYAFIVASGAKGRIGSIATNKAAITSAPRALISNDLWNWEIGSVLLGSTDTLEGVVQLTNAATSTSVTCGHIYRTYVGGSSNYFHPIIQIVPFNSSAAALNNMRVTVTDSSSGTGFTINHASAGASDYVCYKVLGWKVVSRASA